MPVAGEVVFPANAAYPKSTTGPREEARFLPCTVRKGRRRRNNGKNILDWLIREGGQAREDDGVFYAPSDCVEKEIPEEISGEDGPSVHQLLICDLRRAEV